MCARITAQARGKETAETSGNLIEKQEKKSNVHGSEPLRLLHGLDMNWRGPADLSVHVATGLFVKHHDLLGPVC